MLTYNKRNEYLFSWGVPKINKKRFFICILLAFLFIFTDVFSVNLTNVLGTSFNYNIVYAKSSSGGHSSGSSRSSGGSFKSGSFSSPKSSSGTTSSTTNKSSSSDFKSGSFSNTPKSSTVNNNSQTNSSTSTKNYDSGTKRSFLPIPIPIPWGHSSYYGYGSNSFVGSSIVWLFKLIFIIIIIVVIVKLIKRYRRR